MPDNHPHVFGAPHVFGDSAVTDARQQAEAWETLKAKDRAAQTPESSASALDGVSATLPAMTRALKLQNRAARVGFDWTDLASLLEKVEEELGEVKEEIARVNGQSVSPVDPALREELGDLLFSVVNLARKSGIDPETALRLANKKFDRRFRMMEEIAASQNSIFATLSLDQQDILWDEVKKKEARGAKHRLCSP